MRSAAWLSFGDSRREGQFSTVRQSRKHTAIHCRHEPAHLVRIKPAEIAAVDHNLAPGVALGDRALGLLPWVAAVIGALLLIYSVWLYPVLNLIGGLAYGWRLVWCLALIPIMQLWLFASPVAYSRHVLRLTPIDRPGQRVHATALDINPAPIERREGHDFFGNRMTWIELDEPHDTLSVRVAARVAVKSEAPPQAGRTPPWEEIRDATAEGRTMAS